MQTPIERAAKACGSLTKLAETIGVKSVQVVANWNLSGRQVPQEHCPAIEQASGGAVTCEQLRPDLSWGRVADKSWKWNKKGRPMLDLTKAAA